MIYPLVSIVVLNFNRKPDLTETLERCLDINYPNIEFIIVDNGSDDGSVEFISQLDSDKYIKILLPENKGSSIGHSEGMKCAKGKYVLTLDDDAFIRPSALMEAVKILENNNNLGVIGFGLVNPNIKFSEEDYNSETIVDESTYDKCFNTINYTSASIFRNEALIKCGYMDDDWNWSTRTEDLELNFNIIANGYNGVLIPELRAYHKASPSNRNAEVLTINGIHGVIWIILKYYPFLPMVFKFSKITFLCIYFAIYERELFYLKPLLRALNKSDKMFRNKNKLPYEAINKVSIPDRWLFGMSKNISWAGS
jgi:GT2 family glycosyltransferase